MPQVLKEEIRARIQAAALEEFFEQGYSAAAMRRIAEEARVPTGLIYSYYKNKETLFDAVLLPVLYDWQRVLSEGSPSPSKHTGNEVYCLSKGEIRCLLNLFDHHREFILLMDKSAGTKYAGEKEKLIGDIEAHLNAHPPEDADSLFLHIIASNFVDGLLQIMYHYQGKEWAVSLLEKLSKMYLSGIGL